MNISMLNDSEKGWKFDEERSRLVCRLESPYVVMTVSLGHVSHLREVRSFYYINSSFYPFFPAEAGMYYHGFKSYDTNGVSSRKWLKGNLELIAADVKEFLAFAEGYGDFKDFDNGRLPLISRIEGALHRLCLKIIGGENLRSIVEESGVQNVMRFAGGLAVPDTYEVLRRFAEADMHGAASYLQERVDATKEWLEGKEYHI